MPTAMITPTPSEPVNQGSMLLGVSLIVFLCSLAAAGGIWWQLRREQSVAGLMASSPMPATSSLPLDVLSPTVTLDPQLQSERGTIQTNLIEPLRQYWATKPERLAAITVTALPPEQAELYRARVSLRTISPTGEERLLSFQYDLSLWTPSMLDNE